MFCLTAPIALVGELGSYVVPFVGIIAWSLFGIQEIGTQAVTSMEQHQPCSATRYTDIALFKDLHFCSIHPCSSFPLPSPPLLLSRYDDRGAVPEGSQAGGVRQHHQKGSLRPAACVRRQPRSAKHHFRGLRCVNCFTDSTTENSVGWIHSINYSYH